MKEIPKPKNPAIKKPPKPRKPGLPFDGKIAKRPVNKPS